MTTQEDVEEASARIMLLLDRLRRDGYSPKALGIGLIDASVKLSRISRSNYTEPTHVILRQIAALILDMAKDEEAEFLDKKPKLHS